MLVGFTALHFDASWLALKSFAETFVYSQLGCLRFSFELSPSSQPKTGLPMLTVYPSSCFSLKSFEEVVLGTPWESSCGSLGSKNTPLRRKIKCLALDLNDQLSCVCASQPLIVNTFIYYSCTI